VKPEGQEKKMSEKPSAICSDSWKQAGYANVCQALDDSAIYLALVTKSYLEEAHCAVELEYAKFKHKKSLIFVEKGLKYPANLFDGLDILEIIEFDKDGDGTDFKKSFEDALDKHIIGEKKDGT
jgi:hypothetical protein